VLVFLFVLLSLLALAAAGRTVWRKHHARLRASSAHCQTHAALAESIAQRQRDVQMLCERLAERGLLQRHVLHALQRAAGEFLAAQARRARRPHDRQALVSLVQADAAYMRAISQALDSVRPETLLQPGIQPLAQSLAHLTDAFQTGWNALLKATPVRPVASGWASGLRRARTRAWHAPAGWA
jgi:hypothetical protein